MLLALRINVLAKGHSGIAPGTLRQLIDAFNASCLPWVPEQGTVGASGDLAPLSHLGCYQIELCHYRVSHLLVDLGWIDFDLGFPPSCPAASAKIPSAQAESCRQ